MNLDELQSVQSRERQIDSLQQLHDSFYEDAGGFIRQLREEREHVAANADDPFDSDAVQRITDEINTAEQTVEAIYERRIGKLVKQASLEAAGMAADVEGLTQEERTAFDRLVSTIEANRTHVLDEVLAQEPTERESEPTTTTTDETDPPSATTPGTHDADPEGELTDRPRQPESEADPIPDPEPQPDPEPEAEIDARSEVDTESDSASVSASDVMGDGGESVPQAPSQQVPPEMTREDAGDVPVRTSGGQDSESTTSDPATGKNEVESDHPAVDRVTVRITQDVGEILCVDNRPYELSTDDVVTLPETNAGPLIKHDAAVELDNS